MATGDVLTEGSDGLADLVSPSTSGKVLTSNGTGAQPTFETAATTGITQLTGNVTAGPGTGSQVATIANDAVTFAKMQNIATDSLIGRDTAGSGDPENILLNATLSMDGSGNLQRAALTGDITASAGSNATTLANTAVTPGSYTATDLTVDAKGRITAASSGTVGNVTTAATLTSGKTIVGNGGVDVTVSSLTGTVIGSSSGTLAAATAGTDYTALAFKTFAVSGQSDIVADSAADTLTIAAGSNITLTTNAGTDTLTIAAAGSGSGTVTNTGTLTANKAIIGNGGVDVTVSAATGVAHLASGTLTGSNVDLTSEVTGDLPFANLTQIAGLSVLGVTAGSTADVAAITAGTDNHVLTRVSSSSVAFAMPAMVKIDERSPSGTGTVTFSSLGAFTHLRILYSARGTQVATATVINAQFNGDTGANYDRQQARSANTTVSSSQSLAQTSVNQIGVAAAASAPSGAAGVGEIIIYDYRGSTFQKHGTCMTSWQESTASGGTLTSQIGFDWRSTAPITSVDLSLASGNYVAGCKFTCYGMY